MFWLDEELCSDLYLDGIVTVVDSKFCCKQINKEENGDVGGDVGGTRFEFCNQIALADVILLNKIDLVEDEVVEDTLQRVRSINATSKIYKTSYGKISLEQILDLHAYDTGRLDFDVAERGYHLKTTSNSGGHLDNTISTCTLQFDGVLDENDLDRVLESLLWSTNDPNTGTLVLRLKAVVNLSRDPEASYQVQAVYDIFDKYRLPDREALNKVIVIGHNLHPSDIELKFKEIAKLL